MNYNPKRSDQRLKLGVVGCGRVFERYHLPALKQSPNWKLGAVCEPLKQRREWIQEIFQEVAVFESLPSFLEAPALDAVLITTPPATHCQLALQVLEKGLPVLVEKPMALTVSEASLMLETSRRAQKPLWVGFNRRFRAPYLNLKEKLAVIPKDSIQAIRFDLILDSQNWQSVTPYMGQEAAGGGVLDDVASHQLDLLAWLLDQPVTEVKAAYLANKEAGLEGVKYDLKFKNDLVANCVAAHGPRYSENLEIELKDRVLVAYPSGVLETGWLPESWIGAYGRLKTTAHLIFHKLTQKPNVTLESFQKQFNAFAAAVRNEQETFPGADARSGLHSLQAIQACRDSLQAGGDWKSLVLAGESTL